MVQYYTLEQAAQLLQITTDKLKEMVKQGKIRAFQDRGTLRFRSQEIDELVRSRGLGSDPQLQPGGGPASSSGGPSSSARRKSKTAPPPPEDDESSDFNFNLGTDANAVNLDAPPSGADKSTPSSSAKRKTPPARPSRLGGPPPRSSDSDVRLVADGSDLNFDLSLDDPPAPKSKSPAPRPSRVIPTSKPPSSKKTVGKKPDGEQSDSDVRLTPPEPGSDSDVKIVPQDPGDSTVQIAQQGAKRASDSDIRLEPDDRPGRGKASRPGSDPVITEEIDLDLEAKKLESNVRKKGKTQGPALPSSSPFELSEGDIAVPPPLQRPPSDAEHKLLEDSSGDFNLAPPDDAQGPAADSSGDFELSPDAAEDKDSSGDFELAPEAAEDKDSSDFDLTPAGDSEIDIGSDEKPALAEDEVDLGELGAASGASGINLQDPVDSGISLEPDGSDEMEFELTLDSSATPNPASSGSGVGGDLANSEFELSLDDSSISDSTPPSDSEFELSLDDEGSSDLSLDETDSGSDSEFELTLDEDGGLQPVDETSAVNEEDKDLFEETDFDVPSLDEESGSEAMALEESSELALEASSEMSAESSAELALDSSSDFDLAMDDSGLGEGGESESQVVPLGEDEDSDSDDAAETVSRPLAKPKPKTKTKVAPSGLEDEEGLDLDLEASGEEEAPEDEEMLEDEEEGAAPARRVPVETGTAPWGVLPVVFMLPCVIVLILVGMMSWELAQSMWGYHKDSKVSGMVIRKFAGMISDDLPKEDK